MKLQLSNVWATVVESTPAELEWLQAYLTCEDTRYNHQAKKQRNYSEPEVEPTCCMYDPITRSFPAGLSINMRGACRRAQIEFDVEDLREPVCAIELFRKRVSWLRDYQWDAVNMFCRRGCRGLIKVPTGGGKCLAPDTEILRANGEIALARDITKSDAIMGPDGLPRNVLSTTHGTGQMFRIVPAKGAVWECNDVHVLTLAHTVSGTLIDVPLNEYLDWSKSQKHLYKLAQAEGPFQLSAHVSAPVIDPYFLGLWFADGTKSLKSVAISKPDPEVKQTMQAMADEWGCYLADYTYGDRCPTWAIVHAQGAGPNPLLDAMRSVVPNNGCVPHAYTHGSVDVRRQFLAGWVDGDGYVKRGTIEICTKEPKYADAILFVARSLGFKAWSRTKTVLGRDYQRVSIIGPAETLPLRIPRKAAERVSKRNRNPLRTGFKVEALGRGPYCGFTLDGDGRFLLGDFTITHNTEIFIALTLILPCEWLFVVHRKDLVRQTAARYNLRTNETAGIFEGGVWRRGTSNVTVATFQSLSRAMKRPKKNFVPPRRCSVYDLVRETEGLSVDEVHVQPADTFYGVSMVLDGAHIRVGFSGTPLDKSDRENLRTMGSLGPVVYEIAESLLVERGVLAESVTRMIPCEQWAAADASWCEVYETLVVKSRKRNELLAEIIERAAKPCLCFVGELAQARQIVQLVEMSGEVVELAYGKDWDENRKRKLERLADGTTQVLVCTVIFQEGIDVPEIRSVVVGGGKGKSSDVAALQMRGRGKRVHAQKSHFEHWDVRDLGQWWLEDHADARLEAYAKAGDDVQIGWPE